MSLCTSIPATRSCITFTRSHLLQRHRDNRYSAPPAGPSSVQETDTRAHGSNGGCPPGGPPHLISFTATNGPGVDSNDRRRTTTMHSRTPRHSHNAKPEALQQPQQAPAPRTFRPSPHGLHHHATPATGNPEHRRRREGPRFRHPRKQREAMHGRSFVTGDPGPAARLPGSRRHPRPYACRTPPRVGRRRPDGASVAAITECD